MSFCLSRQRLMVGVLLAAAVSYAQANVTVSDAWIREVPPQSRVAAAFMAIQNSAAAPDQIVAMTSPLAERVEWHDMRHEQGRMQMSQRMKPELPAAMTTRLAPMQSHLMLIDLKQPLRVGMQVPIALTLASGNVLRLTAEVRATR